MDHKIQSCIAQSSAEAEYVVAANATQKITWIIKLFENITLLQKLSIILFEDNKSCIKMVESENTQTNQSTSI